MKRRAASRGWRRLRRWLRPGTGRQWLAARGLPGRAAAGARRCPGHPPAVPGRAREQPRRPGCSTSPASSSCPTGCGRWWSCAVGIGIFVYGLRRLLGVLLEPFPAHTQPLVELVYQKRSLARGRRIVAIGGGTGQSTLLRGLKQATSNLTAVVTVADDGGSSGKLREELGIAPVGDIRNCITALADAEPTMTRLLQYRFPTDSPDERGARRARLRQPAHRRALGHRGRLRGGRPAVQPGARRARPGGAGRARAADAPRRAGATARCSRASRSSCVPGASGGSGSARRRWRRAPTRWRRSGRRS